MELEPVGRWSSRFLIYTLGGSDTMTRYRRNRLSRSREGQDATRQVEGCRGSRRSYPGYDRFSSSKTHRDVTHRRTPTSSWWDWLLQPSADPLSVGADSRTSERTCDKRECVWPSIDTSSATDKATNGGRTVHGLLFRTSGLSGSYLLVPRLCFVHKRLLSKLKSPPLPADRESYHVSLTVSPSIVHTSFRLVLFLLSRSGVSSHGFIYCVCVCASHSRRA